MVRRTALINFRNLLNSTQLSRNKGRNSSKSFANELSSQFSTLFSRTSLESRDSSVSGNGHNDGTRSLGLNLLHSPSEPLIDFIFVHGLGGDSRKAWSKTSSPAHFWPKEWLHKDEAFKNVRVHSFGYNANWAKGKKDTWNIHEFGKLLLGEIRTSPYLNEAETAIVFIGHSMGGLVIKKAYILARQDASCQALAKRFHTIYFLATPHRGADKAQLLSNVLHTVYHTHGYVADLAQGSGALQSINEDFRQYSSDIDIWSFYETQKHNVGVFSNLVVDKDSATLGYKEEKQIPINADHCSICKFDSPTDPNYRILRNALVSTIQDITQQVIQIKEKLVRHQIKGLEMYLGVCEKPEDDLIAVEDARLSGSCEWFSLKESYRKWKDFSSTTPNILWLNGKPAAGKTFLAGYIINQLEETKSDCSYFFFKHSDKSKSQLSSCLRSIAFQMALKSNPVREKLLKMYQNDIRFDKDNTSVIWRRIFSSGILQTKFTTQYWVIDALDECVDAVSLFVPILAKLDQSVPLRILITSRESPELENQFLDLGINRFYSEKISTADTLPDIKMLVKMKAESLGIKDQEDRAALVNKILGKSNGSFLWTVLVLKELSNADSEEEINQVLDDVPPGMKPLYTRTLELMSQATGGNKLVKAVLAWSACAMRPLTIDELEGALDIDIKSNFPNLKESIMARCGQLVCVDKSDKVQLIHETAREFLLSNALDSEFAVQRSEAHTRIVRTCLIYLTGEEMKPPRIRRRSSTTGATVQRSAFSVYACQSFSDHLVQSDPSAGDVFVLLDKFLKSNILSWIHVIALKQNLIPLIRTANHIRSYLNSCAAEPCSINWEMQNIRGWTTDLIRVAAKFGDALLTLPSAIYWLVLPFCPTASTVYKTANMGRGLLVVGLSNVHWDDRLSCIDFHEGKTTAVCYGDELFAVGLNTGAVALYHSISCQEYKILDHGEAVSLLQFKCKTDLMVSCGLKQIRVWNIHSGEIIHTFQAPQRTKCLAFEKNLLVAASYGCYLASWDLENGCRRPDRPWYDSARVTDVSSRHSPCAISISLEHKMLAAAYRGRPITLWDLEEDMYYGNCGKKLSNGATGPYLVNALLFNPNHTIGLLAAAYADGELVLLDPLGDRTLERFRADTHVLAASPDGHLLVGADGFGTIQVYEFETLRLLYRIKSTTCNIKQLAFAKDNLHFLDIRRSQCNVWEPPVFIRDYTGDSNIEGTSVSATFVESVLSDYTSKITVLVLHPEDEIAFCGKDDGSVALYDLHTGKQVRTLYRHRSQCLVRILTWWPEYEALMSIDASNTIFAWKLRKSQVEGWEPDSLVLQSRLDCGKSIIQVLADDRSGNFILSTRDSDHLWNIDGQEKDARIYSTTIGIRIWIRHPQSPLHVVCIEGEVARIYAWNDWAILMSVSLNIDLADLQPKYAFPCCKGRRILIEFLGQDGSQNTRALYLVNSSLLETGSITKDIDTTLALEYAAFSKRVFHVIGISDERLIFLDLNSWVCSVNLESLDGCYLRHFFVPYDWFPSARDLVSAVKADESKEHVIFACNDDLAIVKGGLGVEFAEEVKVAQLQFLSSSTS